MLPASREWAFKYCDEFDVQVGVHQGSVLGPLLFIIVRQAITDKFKTGCPWELLYADDLAAITESEVEQEKRFQIWKQNLGSKDFKVNSIKTEVVSKKSNKAEWMFISDDI